ncbi:MAG TPA: hypothetical protein VK034_01220 [Enhygromyxa sp.]|nr:hypothetical protein [Enhygromyxa sp.]
MESDLLPDPEDSDELTVFDSDFAEESAPASDLLLEYRSLYQPPPLRWNAAAVISLLNAPPQDSQVSIGASLNF